MARREGVDGGREGVGAMKKSIRAWGFAVAAAAATAGQAAESLESYEIAGLSEPFKAPARRIEMVRDGFLWVEAEDFADYGGWMLDTQFVHLMGSAYLIAAGVGHPVADASLRLQVPKAGRYRLWVRARNWLPEHSPGRFEVSIAGQKAKTVFGGATAKDWTWEAGGEFDLPQGPAELRLHDTTGYYGRCDALLLTTDAAYRPPEKADALARERAALKGRTLDTRREGDFDVVVAGGGVAGCCAAIAAARSGAKTALIQNRPVLGGNASAEAGVSVNGAGSHQRNAREGGIVEETGQLANRITGGWSAALAQLCEAETNLSVFLNRHVHEAVMAKPDTIAAVRSLDTLSGAVHEYGGRIFIDSTGDGWLGFHAGAAYRYGRESRDEFGESLAPEKTDRITMSGCIMGQKSISFRAEDRGRPVAYTPPAWAPKFPADPEFGRSIRRVTGGEWWVEHPGDIDDLYDAERARDELIRISFGYFDFLKNVWSGRAAAANHELVWVPLYDAKRETRRLVGDYIMRQQDIEEARVFPDRIAHGGWNIDVHHPRGIFSGREGPFDCDPRIPLYTIPYRSLCSTNVLNLMFAARNASVSHVALGSVRVQSTLATMGQAAGTAAALALRRGLTPREYGRQCIGELQQRLLKDDQYIPEMTNQDPADLAQSARITASSTATFAMPAVGKAKHALDHHPMTMPRAVMFARGVRDELNAVSLVFASTGTAAATVTARLRESATFGDFSSTADLAVAEAKVAPGGDRWVKFAFNSKIAKPYAWVLVEPAKGVSIRPAGAPTFEACRAYGGGKGRDWTVVSNQVCDFRTDPPIAVPAAFSVGSLTGGVNRVVGKSPNQWASDPDQALPQWVELAWPQPVRAGQVRLVFDTDMNAAWSRVAATEFCVKDYDVEVESGGAWTKVAEVRDNYQRLRVSRFPPREISKLRVKVLATGGDPSARIFGLRVYAD